MPALHFLIDQTLFARTLRIRFPIPRAVRHSITTDVQTLRSHSFPRNQFFPVQIHGGRFQSLQLRLPILLSDPAGSLHQQIQRTIRQSPIHLHRDLNLHRNLHASDYGSTATRGECIELHTAILAGATEFRMHPLFG